MSAPWFVVPPDRLVPGLVRVEGPEGRHAATVSRLRVGELVVLTDTAGRFGPGEVVEVGRDVVTVALAEVVTEPAPDPRLVVVQALPKGDRGELAVEVMTEVGVDEIVPWPATRCVTRWREGRGDKALARWRSAAYAAGKQARRPRFPQVTDLASTAQVAARLAAADLAVVLHEEATRQLATLDLPAPGDVVLVVGPEGGITGEELAAFEAAGAVSARLGPTVLRTSTAGAAALAVLLARTRWR